MIRVLVVTMVLAFSASALPQSFPNYYPAEGFQQSGTVHAVYADEHRIVINDIPFQYSDAVVVHSMSSYRASFSRVRAGVKIAYKTNSSRQIIELWLLPPNYSEARQFQR